MSYLAGAGRVVPERSVVDEAAPGRQAALPRRVGVLPREAALRLPSFVGKRKAEKNNASAQWKRSERRRK